MTDTSTNKPAACLAVDFGAGSGRVIAGEKGSDGTIGLTELHRFANRPVRLGDSLHWDFPALFAEMCEGIRLAAAKFHVLSIGIDTWGVDFGLLSPGGRLLALPLCYRDSHTAALRPTEDERRRRFCQSGIYPLDINTLSQLIALRSREPEMLRMAGRLLFMPDLFAYFLTGTATCERTIASTSELLLPGQPEWNYDLIDLYGLPRHIFGEIIEPGTVRGHLTADIRRQLGLDYEVPVIAAGGHDTACAVYASSSKGGESPKAFLSSGTWSLLGMVIPEAVITDEAFDAGYTNEGAVGGTVRILQNIPGLWILQQLVAGWTARGIFNGYDSLINKAGKARTDILIDVDDPAFVAPHDMEQAIADYCREHGMTVPATPAEMTRTVLESLARRYRKAIDGLRRVLPPDRHPQSIDIVGGGSRNRLLNRLTEEATWLPVTAGPVEATATGSVMLQFKTLGL